MNDGSEEEFVATLRKCNRGSHAPGLVRRLDGVAEDIIDSSGSRPFIGVVFDAYCRALLVTHDNGEGARSRIQKLCARSRGRFGPQPWTALYEACLRHLGGEDEAAAALYAEAGREVEVLWPTSVGSRSVIGPSERVGFLQAPAPRAPLVPLKDCLAAPFALLVGCDHAYLRRFAPAYLRTVAEFGGPCAVHLHIVNAEAGDLAWLRSVVADELWPRVAVSAERYDGPDERAYFALARLLRLRQVMEQHGCPVLVTDIDAGFTTELSPAVLRRDGADVKLLFKRRDFTAHPWNTIRAGALLARPTPRGLAYADALARLSAGAFAAKAGSGIWFIDQNVLYSLYRELENHPGPTFGDLSADGPPGGLVFSKAL